eukprot:461130-Pyramimonas_sp.AAC.1
METHSLFASKASCWNQIHLALLRHRDGVALVTLEHQATSGCRGGSLERQRAFGAEEGNYDRYCGSYR